MPIVAFILYIALSFVVLSSPNTLNINPFLKSTRTNEFSLAEAYNLFDVSFLFTLLN